MIRRFLLKLVVSVVAIGMLVSWVSGHHGAAVANGHGRTVTTSVAGGPANERLAVSMAASEYNWTGQQATCLVDLWSEESAGTWSPTVTDPLSGAYGIPQALPAGKMASAGPDWRTSAATQIKWGLGYIEDRYGTPCTAWVFEKSHNPNWY